MSEEPIFTYDDGADQLKIEPVRGSRGLVVRIVGEDHESVVFINEAAGAADLASALTHHSGARPMGATLEFEADRRVVALKAAREVLTSRTLMSQGSTGPDELIKVASYVIGGPA